MRFNPQTAAGVCTIPVQPAGTDSASATDSDDAWVLPEIFLRPQLTLVDAQYYANLTDDYYLSRHTLDWVAAAQADRLSLRW